MNKIYSIILLCLFVALSVHAQTKTPATMSVGGTSVNVIKVENGGSDSVIDS